jgi:hypothetical protein
MEGLRASLQAIGFGLTSCIAVLLVPALGRAQQAGTHTFYSLQMPVASRLSAMGGTNISLRESDPLLALANPASLNDAMHTGLGLSFVSYMDGTGYGTANYVHKVENVGRFTAGFQHTSFGEFQGYDQFGNPQGTFSVSDNVFYLGAGRSFGNLAFGAHLKFLSSTNAGYNQTGLAADFGAQYYSEKHTLGLGLTLKNVGRMFNKYTTVGTRDPIPFDLQLGVTKRVPHTPLRFSLTLHDLHRPDLTPENETDDPNVDLQGNTVENRNSIAEDIFRHTIFAAEVLISEHVHLRLGYNHQRRSQLKAANSNFNMAGFNFGAGIKVFKFQIDYAYSHYFSGGGGVHHFGLAANINSFLQSGGSGSKDSQPAERSPGSGTN